MLIASKLLCASEQEYIYESIKTEISCHGELFTASGKNVLQYGWKEVEERFFKSYGKNAEKPEEEESDFQILGQKSAPVKFCSTRRAYVCFLSAGSEPRAIRLSH